MKGDDGEHTLIHNPLDQIEGAKTKCNENEKIYKGGILNQNGLCLLSSAKAGKITSQKECTVRPFKNGMLLGEVDKSGNIKVWQWCYVSP
ncbi:MAG: hypothetical protein GY821_00900 [Gammaproteobacteria bacterium]|nr:hypothetical protein [Gammaproteobacteria bacterium]